MRTLTSEAAAAGLSAQRRATRPLDVFAPPTTLRTMFDPANINKKKEKRVAIQ